MIRTLIHIYSNAEVYAVILIWFVIPVSHWVIYRFLNRNYGMFVPMERKK